MKRTIKSKHIIHSIAAGLICFAGANAFAETITVASSDGEYVKSDYIFTDAQRIEQSYNNTWYFGDECGAQKTANIGSSSFHITFSRIWYKDLDGKVIYVDAGNNQYAVDANYTWNGVKKYNSQADLVYEWDDMYDTNPAFNMAGDGWEIATACYNSASSLNAPGLLPRIIPGVVPPAAVVYGYDSVSGSCGNGQSGTKTVFRKFYHLTNGQKHPNYNFRAIKYENTCTALPAVDVTQTDQVACPTGQLGAINRTRTVSTYTDGTFKSATDWIISSNTCVAAPTQTITPYSYTETCDKYYGAAAGTYDGFATIAGNNVTTFSALTGQTTTQFNPISSDISSCVKQYSDVKQTLTTSACPDGQTGSIITSVVTAENGTGSVIYPVGSTPIPVSNTCTTPTIADTVSSDSTTTAKQAVLANMTYKLSSLSVSGDSIASSLSQFDASQATDKHTLNIIANDMSAQTLNPSNVSKVIKAFKAASGSTNATIKVVAVSQNLYDYVGQGGLTAQSIADNKLVLLNASEDSGVITVKYASYKNQMKAGEKQSFTVKVYN